MALAQRPIVWILWHADGEDEIEFRGTAHRKFGLEDIYEHACPMMHGEGVLYLVDAKSYEDAEHAVRSFETGSRFRKFSKTIVADNVVGLGRRSCLGVRLIFQELHGKTLP